MFALVFDPHSKEIRKLLRSISHQALKTEKDPSKILTLLTQFKQLCSEPAAEGELPPGAMVIQMHLKNAFFNSEGIKGIYYQLWYQVPESHTGLA